MIIGAAWIGFSYLIAALCGYAMGRATVGRLPAIRSEPVFSILRFRSVLVKHDIIFPEAIEDAEGFDGERTLAATRAAYDELMENAQGHVLTRSEAEGQ